MIIYFSFEGEDVSKIERKALQIQQQKCWLSQQIMEKRQNKLEKELADKINYDCMKWRESRAMHLDQMEKECRRQIKIANKAFNEALVSNSYNFNFTIDIIHI